MSVVSKHEKHKRNLERWDFIRDLEDHEYVELGYKKTNRRSLYRCKQCGAVKSSTTSDFKRYEIKCPTGCYKGLSTVGEKNCLATTHPHLVECFVDREEAYRHSAGSSVKTRVCCPVCGKIKTASICDVTRDRIRCKECRDTTSYPERFMANLLNRIEISFSTQYSIGNDGGRYDFYIEEHSMIIETHGCQHYEQSPRPQARTLEEEQENDRIKKEEAFKNGIKHYVVIDSRNSSMEWMRSSILNSELPKLLGFRGEDIDWNEVDALSQKAIVKEVCDYWENHEATTTEVSKAFGICSGTVVKYLKKGTKYGWCNYDPQEEAKKKCLKVGKSGRYVRGEAQEGGEIVVFPTVANAEEWLRSKDIHQTKGIYNCSKGGRVNFRGYTWEYITKEQYEEYIKQQEEQLHHN